MIEQPIAPEEVAAFNGELNYLMPPNEQGRYLYAYWEPGFPWGAIGRWVIAEVTPRWALAKEGEFYAMLGEHQAAKETVLHELEGEDPWAGGHYCTQGNCACSSKRERFVYRQEHGLQISPSITHRQWELYRQLGGLAKPIWIVQGKNGGHKRHFNEFEKALNRIRGRPVEAPYPGELPYAPLDERVISAIRRARELDKLATGMREDWAYRAGNEEQHRIEGVTDAERTLYKEWSAWIDDSVENTLTR